MKFSATIALFLIVVAGYGQNCSKPVPSVIFQQRFNLIVQQNEDQMKLIVAKDFVEKYCLTSSQVKSIALLFSDDANRLTFCKEASSHILDMVNFYDVYDAFGSFSYAFRLHDYIHQTQLMRGGTKEPTPDNPVKPAGPSFPAIAYPSYTSYNEQKGCTEPVVELARFNSIALNVFHQPTDESKMVTISNAFDEGNCFSFAYTMKLVSLIEKEQFRLKELKEVFLKVYDLKNYQAGKYLFKTYPLQQEWLNYATQALKPEKPAEPVAPVCSVTADEFSGIMASLRRVHFSQEKMQLMTGLVKDRCFNVDQIKIMMKEFISGKDALEVARMCWWRCTEQKNYYQVVDALTFSTDKEDLRRFIAQNSH